MKLKDPAPASDQTNTPKQHKPEFLGLLSILAIASLIALTIPYVNYTFFGKDSAKLGNITKLLVNPEIDFGPEYYSPVNFKFTDEMSSDLFEEMPKKPL